MTRAPAGRRRASAPAPRLLWGSPLPPIRSGVADYAADLLPEVARHAQVSVLAPPSWTPAEDCPWLAGIEVLPWDAPGDPEAIPLLHLGNNPYHLWIAERLRRSPAFVVVHDTVLHHLLVEEAASDQQWQRFAAELEAAHPGRGEAVARARRWGVRGRLDPFLLPARSAYLQFARGAIVHSEQARRDITKACPSLPVRVAPLAVGALPAGDRERWRQRLGLGPEELLVAHLGFLTPAKGLETILQALVALGELGVLVRLVVVGEGSDSPSFVEMVKSVGLDDRVLRWGWASEQELGGVLSATDVGLVPRYPTAGETSAAVLRFLAAGVPVAVAGYAQFLELPADAALRIAPGQRGLADLVRTLAQLARSPAARERARRAARRTWEKGDHAPDHAAPRLLAALAELHDGLAR